MRKKSLKTSKRKMHGVCRSERERIVKMFILLLLMKKEAIKQKKYVYLKEAIIPTTYILGRTKNKT